MNRLFLLFILILIVLSCNDDSSEFVCKNCCPIILDEDKFELVDTSNYTLQDVEILDDCLEVSFTSSGCDGSTWSTIMYSGYVTTLNDGDYVSIALYLQNLELCDAVIAKSYSYDLSRFKSADSINTVNIQLKGWDEPIIYEY